MLEIMASRAWDPDPPEVLLRAFRAIDEKGAGYIETAKMSELLVSKGTPFRAKEIEAFLSVAKDLFDRGNHRELLTRSTPGKGWRAIHFACHSGSNEAVSWLLGLDACDPSARTAKGETALHLSAIRGDERMCETLINGGCSAEAVTLEGKTALHLAAEMGHLPVTRFLVVGAGLSPATQDGGGASAAALALAGNHKSVVRLLQKNCPGVPMGIPKRTNSRRASDFGALISSPDFQKGWDYGAKGRKGRERRSGRVSLGGDGGGRGKGGGGGNRGGLKGADEAGRRLLEAARVGDTMAMGRVLARGEIDVEWVGRSNGWTALMEAAEHGSLEAVCYLLDTGADLEHTNKKGLTPLQLAVRAGHLGVTEELLTRGARPNVKSKAGLCLRCLASSMGHDYLVDWLFAMGVADGEDGGCACSGGSKAGGSGGGGGGGGGGDAVSNGLATREISGGATSNNGNGAPPGQALTSAASVALTEWLGNLGLSTYESRLVSQGFDTLEAMSTATESDLESMGFKKGHLRLLLARAPFAVASFGGGSVNVAAAVEQVGLTRTESTLSTTATIGYNVGNGFVEAATRPARFAAPQAETQGDGDEDEEGKDRYCDASALQPSRALSNSASEGDGRSDGSGDGFKELKPEEVDIDDVIGEGSFGVVRRARWRGMDVAVKELKTSIASAAAATAAIAAGGGATAGAGVSAAVGGGRGGAVKPRDGDDLMDGQEEMRHEARMLAKVCNHNCVVQFVGVLFRPTPSVVTMFMENGSVEDMLVSSNSPAKKELVVRMAIEAAKGVIHLHREGVVHRDLASRNLLLDDGFHVRISDFGFSRVKRECASRGYTRSDMGPIKWTSPEAMRKRCYSEASDAFSFGVVLYEMFARSPPWEGNENLDVAFRVCSGERMTVPDRVDAPIAELMSKCWDGNPRSRPDFASILTALTEFADRQRQAGEEAALVAAAPPSPSGGGGGGGGSKKSTAATKTAKAKAEAAALAKAAVAEFTRRRNSAALEAVAELQRRDAEASGAAAADGQQEQQQGQPRRDGGGIQSGVRRRIPLGQQAEASGQQRSSAAAYFQQLRQGGSSSSRMSHLGSEGGEGGGDARRQRDGERDRAGGERGGGGRSGGGGRGGVGSWIRGGRGYRRGPPPPDGNASSKGRQSGRARGRGGGRGPVPPGEGRGGEPSGPVPRVGHERGGGRHGGGAPAGGRGVQGRS
eukprot:g1302.t1